MKHQETCSDVSSDSGGVGSGNVLVLAVLLVMKPVLVVLEVMVVAVFDDGVRTSGNGYGADSSRDWWWWCRYGFGNYGVDSGTD